MPTSTRVKHYTDRWEQESHRRADDVLEDQTLDLEGRATLLAREVVRRVTEKHLWLGIPTTVGDCLSWWQMGSDCSLFSDFYDRLSDHEKSRVLVKLRNLHDRGSF